MLSLHDLQKNFIAALKSENELILNYIHADEKLSEAEHLAIYKSSIFGAKQKVLKEIYPVCHKLVGGEFFIAMINRYIPKTISQSPDIGHYGADFSEFIAEFEPAKSLPYLSDVARLELAWHQVYSAAESPTFDFQKLAECYEQNGGKIIFQLPPSSVLISSPYPIHRIWEVSQEDYQGEQNIILPENVQFNLFVWHKALTSRIDILETADWQILHWIQTGINFDTICNKVSEEFPELRIDEVLPKIINWGWVVDFSLEP